MANRLQYSVSVTPIFTHTNAEGPDSDVVASDFGKSFGGSGKVSSLLYGANGVTATVNHTSGTLVTTPASCLGLFIRHTGLDENGDVITTTLAILIGATQICTLEAGGAVFLPTAKSSQAFTATPSSGQIKVEYAAFV